MKICREMPPGVFRVDSVRRFFNGDPASRTKIDIDAEDSRSSNGSGPATRPCRKGKGKTQKDHGGLPKGTPMAPTPSLLTAIGIQETASNAKSPRASRVGAPGPGEGSCDDTPPGSRGEGPPTPYCSRESHPANPRRDTNTDCRDMNIDDDIEVDTNAALFSGGGPPDSGPPGPPGEGPP